MSWDAFLRKMADDFNLSPEQTQVFLERFDERNQDKKEREIEQQLKETLKIDINSDAYIKRRTGIYDKFTWSKQNPEGCQEINYDGPHKFKKLLSWLKEKHSDWLLNQASVFTSPNTTVIAKLQERSRQIVKEKLRPSINSLLVKARIWFESDTDLYVDLNLAERRPKNNKADDTRMQFEDEQEQTLAQDDFLTYVIGEGKSHKSQGKRIAVIGEPGSGKTTQLQQIAAFVLKNPDFQLIWIDLKQDSQKSLKQRLSDWLNKAYTRTEEIPLEWKTAFEELLKSGQVWVLLDGLDEIGQQTDDPIGKITTDLEGLLNNVRVVISCRVNLWDTVGRNTLSNFDTYRTLPFESTEVSEFINKRWFKDNRELGQELQNKLNEQERLLNLVTNPLRLTLLCYIWQKRCQELPNAKIQLPHTKAALYKEFVELFYKWTTKISLEERHLLDQKLPELARLALEQEKNQFQLRRSFIFQVLREFLQLTCQVGWLVPVGEELGEEVYEFFHPTFQEYFAACAIENWQDFLNHVPENPKLGIYLIFEPQWKEVILLWLGRKDVGKQKKEEFITELVEFEDRCRKWIFGYKGFYDYRAYFLAAAGIAEFKFTRADEIIKNVVKWSFGSFNVEHHWRETEVPRQIAEVAKAILPETYRPLVIAALIGLLTSPDEYTRIEAAESLGLIVPGHSEAIATLMNLINTSSVPGVIMQAIIALEKIANKNQEEITPLLLQLIHNSPDPFIRYMAAQGLGKIEPDHPEAIILNVVVTPTLFEQLVTSREIDPGNPESIASLVQLIRSSPKNETEQFNRRKAVEYLGHSIPGHLIAIEALINLISNNPDKETLGEAVRSLGGIGINSPEAIKILIDMSKSPELDIRLQAIRGLGKINTSYAEVISALIDIISTMPYDFTCSSAANSLRQILQRYPLKSAVSTLKDCLPAQIYNQNDSDLYQKCYDILFGCAQTMRYPVFYQAWHSPSLLRSTQSLNLANLPQLLHAAIKDDRTLNQTVHLICINSSKFIDPDNPSSKIYTEMVKAGCPKSKDGTPKTMGELQAYWDLLEYDKRIVLVFYDLATPTPQGFSDTFINALSKFDGEICIVTSQSIANIPLQQFHPDQPQLISDIVKWISAIED